MHLLDTTTLELREVHAPDIPAYAILSHTWSGEELTFQQVSALQPLPEAVRKQKGFLKIQNTCKLALKHGLGYAWIDTCCIDKSSSAELTESINSMYQFYAAAERCYIHLEDLAPDCPAGEGFPSCRWFTRGWTLQELLAPKELKLVHFYDSTWTCRGSKQDFAQIISTCTGISKSVLLGSVALTSCSIAERMSWAAGRQTTRIEDVAYCLLGIFDVNMPLLYGEGTKSFRRLQEEIVKRENDLTILAWQTPKTGGENAIRLFAESPVAFLKKPLISAFKDDFVDFSITNQGLYVSGEVPLRVISMNTRDGDKLYMYALLLGTYGTRRSQSACGIYLRKLGPKIFARDYKLPLAMFGDDQARIVDTLDEYPNFYILAEPNQRISRTFYCHCSLHIPSNESFEIRDTVPEALWDVTNRVFLKPKPYSWTRYPMVVAMKFRVKLLGVRKLMVIFCDYRDDKKSNNKKTIPSCKVFWEGDYPREEALIFRGGNRNESVYWSQVEIDAPHILTLNNTVETRWMDNVIHISARFEKGMGRGSFADEEIFSMRFDVGTDVVRDNDKGELKAKW